MPDAEPEGDPTDPAYWCHPRFKIVAPAPSHIAMLTCPYCGGCSYYDGAGKYICSKCHKPAA